VPSLSWVAPSARNLSWVPPPVADVGAAASCATPFLSYAPHIQFPNSFPLAHLGSLPLQANVSAHATQGPHSTVSWVLPPAQGFPQSFLVTQPVAYQLPFVSAVAAGQGTIAAPLFVIPAVSPIPDKFAQGTVVAFDRKGSTASRFRCISVLGEGSFSKVWLAEAINETGGVIDNSEGVALKDMFCKTEASFQQVLFEVELLEWAAKASADAASGRLAPRTARCVAQQVDKQADGWRVKMAMTRVPGETVEAFMLRTPPPGQDFAVAVQRGCALSAQLLMQMAPTLDCLAQHAWHRDINSRNIMISDALDGVMPALVTSHPEESGSRASFWLIDFGLAVRSSTWVAPESRWRDSDLAGDVRYWPQSTFFKFLYGTQELAARTDLCNQYQTRLDIHALGLLAIEMLCAISAGGDRSFSSSLSESQTAAWDSLLAAWSRYQRNVAAWHRQIFQVFRDGGNIEPVRRRMVHEGVFAKLMDLMHNLRCCLRTCAFLSVDLMERALLQSLSEMIDERSTFGLQDALRSLQMPVPSGVQDALRSLQEKDAMIPIPLENQRVSPVCSSSPPWPAVLASDPTLTAADAVTPSMLEESLAPISCCRHGYLNSGSFPQISPNRVDGLADGFSKNNNGRFAGEHVEHAANAALGPPAPALSPSASLLGVASISDRPPLVFFQEGQTLEYLSASVGSWIQCAVIATRADGAVQIDVKKEYWMELQEQSSKLRLPGSAPPGAGQAKSPAAQGAGVHTTGLPAGAAVVEVEVISA